MNAKQTAEAKRALRMSAFAKGHATDFVHVPLTPADQKHAATITKLDTAITALGGKEAIQNANEFGEDTEELRGDRGTVEATLRSINTTVAANAEETNNPSMMDRFRMPHGNGDTELASKLRGFATALTDLNLYPVLAEHSLVLTPAGLEQMATDLLSGTGQQGASLGKQVGATASIPDSLKDARSCKKTFDAIYGNFYSGNTAVLADWNSVSHVPRSGGATTTPATTPDKTPPSK